jgi:hypothetical protein
MQKVPAPRGNSHRLTPLRQGSAVTQATNLRDLALVQGWVLGGPLDITNPTVRPKIRVAEFLLASATRKNCTSEIF